MILMYGYVVLNYKLSIIDIWLGIIFVICILILGILRFRLSLIKVYF